MTSSQVVMPQLFNYLAPVGRLSQWFVVINVSSGAKEKGLMAGVAIGAVVGLEAMFAGPISGASMNPARSLGPAILSGHVGYLWIYVTAPLLGAALGILGCRGIQARGCCTRQGECG